MENNPATWNDNPFPFSGKILAAPYASTIWANETIINGALYSVTFPRPYRGKEQDQRTSASSFGRNDLLLVAIIADAAHTWIFE